MGKKSRASFIAFVYVPQMHSESTVYPCFVEKIPAKLPRHDVYQVPGTLGLHAKNTYNQSLPIKVGNFNYYLKSTHPWTSSQKLELSDASEV